MLFASTLCRLGVVVGAVACVGAASAAPELRILDPKPGSIYFLDPDIPAESQWIPLRADAPGAIHWTSDTGAKIATARLWLSEGRHHLTALDESTGASRTTWIEVRA